MSNSDNPKIASSDQIIAALADLNYTAKMDGHLITMDVSSDLGLTRSYTIELVDQSWSVHLKKVTFEEGNPEEEEEEEELGSFTDAMDVARAVDDAEND